MYEVQVDDLPEQVYQQIKDMILNGELKPGQKLIQEDLASKLGVSRTPLLTAFRSLEKELLVELIPRRGAFVRENTDDDLIHVFDIRLSIEPLASGEAALRITPEGLKIIEKRHKEFTEAVAAGNRILYRRADYDFHYSIMELSANPYIPKMLSSVNLISISNVSGLVTDPEISLAGHERIMDALRNGNPDEAKAAMTYHLNLARNKLMEHRNI